MKGKCWILELVESLFKNTVFKCSHGVLVFDDKRNYVCEKCGLKIPFKSAYAAVKYLADKITEEAEDGCELDITNYVFAKKNKDGSVAWRGKVKKYNGKGMEIIINEKA